MIRSGAWHLAHAHTRRTTTLILTRHLQTFPTPGDSTSTKNPVPGAKAKDARKPQVKLHPAPIKVPKSSPAAPLPHTSLPPAPPTVQTVEPLSLKSIKETTVRDIADAESHGILAPPPPGAGWAKSTLHKAIQLAKFYYRGVKLVYTRSNITREIRQRVQDGGAPLTRWEYRMLHTQTADMKRLVPFVLTALIIEELIPVIVLYAPSMLPSTCILPSQRDRIQEKAMDKALQLKEAHGVSLLALTRAAADGVIPLNALSGQDITKAICGFLRLSTFGIDSLRVRRIRNHLTFIEEDDALLAKEDLRHLSAQAILEALHERGVVTRGLNGAEQLMLLKWWLKSVNEDGDALARRLYLVASMAGR